MSKIRIYACGGAGTNIALKGIEDYDEPSEVFASAEVVYIDTSTKDIESLVGHDRLYSFGDEVDGSGGLRRENVNLIRNYSKDILQKHPPLDLNIVISSASGGSGAVINPVLTRHLLERDALVVVILIGAKDSRNFINNSLNTLKSFESISMSLNKTIPLSYFENQSISKQKEVDEKILFYVSSLCLLFSGKNKSLDSKDLEHWINYNKVTSFQPRLSSLEIIPMDVSKRNDTEGNIISVASLGVEDSDFDLGLIPEVHYTGYVNEEYISKGVRDSLPLHFLLTDSSLEAVSKRLTELLKELEQAASSRIERGSILSTDDNVDEDGLIL